MTTKNIEKEFKIEVIASLLENRLLKTKKVNVTEDDIYDLCSFISNTNINKTNFYKIGNCIKNILLEMHPELNIRINHTCNDELYDFDIIAIIDTYKNKFGSTYKIKSVKKCIIKTLKIQD